jgi:predicted DNA-binding protein
MATTVKRITLALSKEDLRQLEMLSAKLGEHQSTIIKRAIADFHSKWFNIEDKR